MISSWGATILLRGISICGALVFIMSIFGEYSDTFGNTSMGLIGIATAILCWFLPKWMGMTDK